MNAANSKRRWIWFLSVWWILSVFLTIGLSIFRNMMMMTENPKNDTEGDLLNQTIPN